MRQNTLAPWAELVPDTGPMTADELLALPEDEWKYELVDGRLVRMPPTGLEHFDVTDALHAALRTYVRASGLGIVTLPDTGFRLTAPDLTETVLSPDVAFVRAERVAQLPPPGDPARKKFLPLAPDLAAEIASPDQYRPEMAEKARRYLAA
ncbi:MAG TPA: Uma2 family endonuclease, partial [Ktedonobacterales bacterium]